MQYFKFIRSIYCNTHVASEANLSKVCVNSTDYN